MTGVNPTQPEKQVEVLRAPSSNENKEKTKYLRGRYRFAYIYVASATATLDEQSSLLERLLKSAQPLKKSCAATKSMLDGNFEIVPITLPRNFVTLSIRVNMHTLKQSKLLTLVEGHKSLRVYFRKPRQDTQHLSSSLNSATKTVKTAKTTAKSTNQH
jgi:hypothetical protein